jgi:hypothetical protein
LDAGEGARSGFQVVGLGDKELAEIAELSVPARDGWLKVFVTQMDDPPPMMGEVEVVDKVLRFTPRHPLEPGVRYRAEFRRGGETEKGAEPVSSEFEIPKTASEQSTSLLHVYPTSDELPENQLKFYFHFSASMGRGQAYRNIHLLDESGREVEGAFLELNEELWDPPLRRFTLLLDPGRVKRGLKPREELGPVLEVGKRYTLVADRTWVDANGEPLESDFRKSFVVLAPIERPIDVAAWQIEPPAADSNGPFVVRFPDALDHSLLERLLWISDAATNSRVAGTVEIRDDETTWQFLPQQPWTAGDYQLVATTTLEDLAGNSIGRAFEVDTSNADPSTPASEIVAIPFSIDDLAIAGARN